jgi:hypothetical protein
MRILSILSKMPILSMDTLTMKWDWGKCCTPSHQPKKQNNQPLLLDRIVQYRIFSLVFVSHPCPSPSPLA